MLVIAHRGANQEALENSWEAFGKAIEGGATRLELDVHLTSDQEVVICHDRGLARVTGLPGHVGEMTRRQIEALHLSNGEPLPFLDDVIKRLLPQVELNIEIKGRSTELARRVARLVDTFGVADRVVVSSFEVEPLEWLADHAPEIPRACLWGGVWPRWPDFATFSPLVFMRRARASIAHPMASLVTPELMDQARARDWKVYAWMPMVGEEHDREEKWTRLASVGVDGLCTNYPRQLAAWLRENAAHTRMARRLAEVPATFSRISQ